jgi:hypothetical protein
MEKLSGKVKSYKAISQTQVQVEFNGLNKIIEISVDDPWVINKGDNIVVAGENDKNTGKFEALAYKNITKNVVGFYKVSVAGALLFIGIGFMLIWAIFPIIHVIIGFKQLNENKKSKNARDIVAAY